MLVERVVILVVLVQLIAWFIDVIEVNLLNSALSFLILDNVASLAAQAASEGIHGFDWVS